MSPFALKEVYSQKKKKKKKKVHVLCFLIKRSVRFNLLRLVSESWWSNLFQFYCCLLFNVCIQVIISVSVPSQFHLHVTVVARKRSRSFCQKRRWQVRAKYPKYVDLHEVTL